MATIADVARRAGVSIATVSRVLSPGARAHPVNTETADRVREAAAELDFVPSALASGLASRHSRLLGLVVPDLADPHYPHVARGAEDAARAHGLALLVCNTLGDSSRFAEYLRLLRARRVDAVILSGGGSLTAEDLEAVTATGLVAVLIGRPTQDTVIPYVAVDNVAAARAATCHLLEGGRQRVVHLAGPLTHTTMADRANGYQDAMATKGLRPTVISTDGSMEDGLRTAVRLLSVAPASRAEGIFAATDRLALATLRAAATLGLRIPDDLALMGFDDVPIAAYLYPSLSSVAQPARELGEAAISLALNALAGNAVAPLLLPARLVIRESSSSASRAATTSSPA